MAGQRTMSGMFGELTVQPFVLPVVLTSQSFDCIEDEIN